MYTFDLRDVVKSEGGGTVHPQEIGVTKLEYIRRRIIFMQISTAIIEK